MEVTYALLHFYCNRTYLLEMSSGPILAIRARPGPEQLSAQPARARKNLYDQGPGPPEPDYVYARARLFIICFRKLPLDANFGTVY